MVRRWLARSLRVIGGIWRPTTGRERKSMDGTILFVIIAALFIAIMEGGPEAPQKTDAK